MRAARHGAVAWLGLSAVVIVLDQLTKAIVLHTLEPYVPHPVIPGFFNWTLAFNTGAAFSFLADQEGWQRWLFTALAIVVSFVLARWLALQQGPSVAGAAPDVSTSSAVLETTILADLKTLHEAERTDVAGELIDV